jgi:hypothetical protein
VTLGRAPLVTAMAHHRGMEGRMTPDEVETITRRLDETAAMVAELARQVAQLATQIQRTRSRPAPEGR